MTFYSGPGVVLRVGELFLKGKNRHLFEDALYSNVKRTLSHRSNVRVSKQHGRIFVLGNNDQQLLSDLCCVFGISSLSEAVFCEKDLEILKAEALKMAKSMPIGASKFRISAHRSDKNFGVTSPDLNRIIGKAVANATQLKVDLEQFDLEIGIEVGPDWAFVWKSKIPGAGGLPSGTSGRALLLLSGGIDSPVAGHLMQKRGLDLFACYFHSFPYTGDSAKDKVARLVKVLAKRQDKTELFVVPFAKIQEKLKGIVEARYLVVLYRRTMIRIAQAIAKEHNLNALVTGESLGQVASQTLNNLAAIEDAATMPILRPLIGFDKNETIAIARRIGTYEISIEPHEDSCSLFVPKHPETKAQIKYVRAEESKADLDELIEEAINAKERLTI